VVGPRVTDDDSFQPRNYSERALSPGRLLEQGGLMKDPKRSRRGVTGSWRRATADQDRGSSLLLESWPGWCLSWLWWFWRGGLGSTVRTLAPDNAAQATSSRTRSGAPIGSIRWGSTSVPKCSSQTPRFRGGVSN